MVVRDNPDGTVTLIRQHDHARLSGRLAERWGSAPWRRPEPHVQVALGAELHDLAWVGWDADALDGGGRPLAFYEVPRTTTAPMYRRGVDAVEQIDAYAGLLASLHYSGLFTSHWGWQPLADVGRMAAEDRRAVGALLAHERTRQRRLRAAVDADDEELERAYKYLQLWDRISLDVCRHRFDDGWRGAYPAVEGIELSIALTGPDRCVLAPYPLTADPFRAAVTARTLGAAGDHSLEVTFTSAA